jgi:photosystem II stability/assembly factor-like uncharacterized protein
MRLKQLALALALVPFAVAPTAASATSWTEVASGTTSEISAIEYQDASHLWFTTKTGEIFTRQTNGSFARTFGPSAIPLNDIEFAGNVGVAVGNAGQVLRSTDAGATWSDVNPASARIPVSKKATSSTFNNCTATEPLGDVNAVRFAGSGQVWLFGEGSQIARSTGGDVGAAGTWSDANRDTKGTPVADDDTCKVPITYNQGGGDAFFPTANVGYFCTAFFGEVFFTADNLANTAAKKTADCGNGTLFNRRLAGDPSNPNRMWAVAPGGPNASYLRMTTDGWTSSTALTLAHPEKRELGSPYDVDYAGGTVLVAGDQGMILSSTDGTTFNFVDAGGALATEGWRAAALASSTAAAVGGTGGKLALASDADSLLAKPTLPPSSQPPVSGGAAKRSGKYIVFKVNGRIGVPAGVSKTDACKGRVNLSIYKGKKRLSASRATIKSTCKYRKTVKVKRSKAGTAKRLKLKVAFKGNDVLAPLSSTYNVKVKK